MIYTIENESLRVAVSTAGAELQSIYGKATDTEYLWQGDAAYWDERSPVLFPICGRLTEGKYTYRANTYEMSLHGFARHADYTADEVTPHAITLTLVPTEEHARIYPFAFRFRVRYSLTGSTLRWEFLVDNVGEDTLPFSFGAHPGFRVPLADGEDFSDYRIAFAEGSAPKQVVISPTGHPTGELLPYPLTDGAIALSHEFFDGAGLFLADMGDTVMLRSVTGARGVRLCYTGMTHLGFWKPDHTDAPFVCIEPWHGLPTEMGVTDDFATKPYMIRLGAGESYEAHVDITVE